MTAVSSSAPASSLTAGVERFIQWLLRHWLLFVGLALGIWTLLPWLAPVLMRLGWHRPARWLYFSYGLFCHQLPQRSWFLFGPQFTPSLAEIQAASGAGGDFFALRHFLGTPELGWKLAWSDRMVSFYGGWFVFVLLYALLRRRIRGLRWQIAALFLLPMALDGITHAISDLRGVTAGFRQSNAWLAVLTGNALPPTFYMGDAWGSFNSLARLVTGLLAAFGLIFWLLPLIDQALRRDRALTPELTIAGQYLGSHVAGRRGRQTAPRPQRQSRGRWLCAEAIQPGLQRLLATDYPAMSWSRGNGRRAAQNCTRMKVANLVDAFSPCYRTRNPSYTHQAPLPILERK